MSAPPLRVAVIAGNRIPFARSNSVYSHQSNQDLLTAALTGLIDRCKLHGERLGEVVGGAVLKHARDRDLTRESVLGTTLSAQTPAYDLQQACATGLESTIAVANKIALGQIEAGIACGADTTSDAPIAVSEQLRRTLLEANRQRSIAARVRTFSRFRPAHLMPLLPRNEEPRTGLSMGEHCALMAEEWKIDRTAQDQLAARSHQRLDASYGAGFQDELVSPYLGLQRDQNLRPDCTVQRLAQLSPVFGGPHGTMTAGNSTPLSDGASAVLLASERWANERRLPVMAYFTAAQTAAVDYLAGREGLLMAPVHAMPRLLARTGMTLGEFDFYEIHEAFAAQVLCTLRAWEDPEFCKTRLDVDAPLGAIDPDRLNVNGGSLAAGHPFAATGARIVAALAKELQQAASGRGVISICAAGGQGALAILQAPDGA
jgi:acetyl-CoA C-acetyltransferase